MSMDNGLLRNTTKVGVVRLDWLATIIRKGKGLRHSYEYGQRSAAQHDEGGSRATRLVGY